ncbi:MAG: BACON domain-containing carbohydrate-binding protein [Bryobacteraceae bacterium]
MRPILLLAALAAPLAAQQCGWVFSPNPIPALTAAGGSGTLTLTPSPFVCAWTYSTDSAWITVSPGPAGTGPGAGSLNWTAAPNLTAAKLTGNILIYDYYNTYKLPITEDAATCSLTLGGTGTTIGAAASTASLTLQTGCVWNAASGVSWITAGAGGVGYATGTGSGSFSFNIAANSCYTSRTGSLTVQAGWATPQASAAGSQQYTLTQSGSDSNLTVSPASVTLSSAGGTGTVQVTTGAGCPWSASSNVSWMTITNISATSGNGYVAYQVLANTSTARSGVLQIGPQSFTVTEQSVPAPVPQVAGVTSAASFLVGPVSPGDIISIFGSNLGPALPGVGAQLNSAGTALTTTLGGTQVFFDGAAAALTYAGAGQVNAVVPYEVAGKTTTQMTVAYQGATSAPATLNVQATTPAVFSLDFTGQGNGAILNQNKSLNGKANPAARGSVVQIFLTGGGVTDPASTDGWITTQIGGQWPLLVAQPVTVTIGGVAATQINYAGAAPDAVAGLTQINAVVPDSVTPGSALPLVIQIGTAQSQSGIAIAVE